MTATAPDFDAAREAYETARAWLAFLIDHPDKSVTVAEYRGMLAEARAGVRVANEAWMGVGA